MSRRIVYFDTETGGLDPTKHPLIQWAGVAIEDGKELEALEVKLHFDEKAAEKEALELNHYDQAEWAEFAVPPMDAIEQIGNFLRRHSAVAMMSKAGRPYKVAQGAGYNVSFDLDFTRALFASEEMFLPLSWRGLDVMSLAMWHYIGTNERHDAACDGALKAECLRHAQTDFRLTTVAAFLRIEVTDEAHDALFDARLAWRVAEKLR